MKYDSVLFDPPAPVARAIVVNPATGQRISDVPMLLDTGADVSLLPQWCVEQLGIRREVGEPYGLAGYDGMHGSSMAVVAQVLFLSHLFKGKYLIREDPVGVIGRNVLNHLTLKLNGRELMWDLENP